MNTKLRRKAIRIVVVLAIEVLLNMYLSTKHGGPNGVVSLGVVLVNIFGMIVLAFMSLSYFFSAIFAKKTENSQIGNNSNQANEHYQKAEPHDTEPSYTEEDIKNLYRELQKKYHPDFARSDEDKKFRTELTAKINKAYKEKDIETLKLFK